MKLLNPAMRLGKPGGRMNPHLCQTARDHQPRQPRGGCQMALIEPKAATFLLGKHARNPKAHPIAFERIVGICQRCDQLDRFLLLGVPDPQQQDWAILLGGHAHIHHGDRRAACARQIADGEDPVGRSDQDVGGGTADIRPVTRPYGGRQRGAVKLAIAEQRDGRSGRDQLLKAANERAMQLLGQMALLALDHRPQHGNGMPTIDQAGHQDHTAASGGRAIEQDGQGPVRQSGQQRARKRQPDGVGGAVRMFDEAPKARDQPFVRATADRGVAGEFIELDMLRPHHATDQQGQGVEVLFGMAIGAGMPHLRQRTFAGTLGLEGAVHGTLLSSDVVIMTEGYHAHWLPIVAPRCPSTRLAHIFCTVAKFTLYFRLNDTTGQCTVRYIGAVGCFVDLLPVCGIELYPCFVRCTKTRRARQITNPYGYRSSEAEAWRLRTWDYRYTSW